MSDLSGQSFGKYQLIQRLGRGGMADVYKGYQPNLDRYVAIKILHSHLSEDANFITRFKAEAKAVARLRHPHITQVFDFDIEDDRYYMVMEYIEGGRTLKGLLKRLADRKKHIPIEHGLSIGGQLADALDYAHNQGMIHRDIKPANVLMRTIDNAVLGDFGIVRMVGVSGLTHSGAMIGTPTYMSPEQGRGEPADARSDIYSLGVIIYEMMTGIPPFDADTPFGVILKHINDPVISPRTYLSMSSSVERIVLKCLEKDPAKRYQTAKEVHEAITFVLEDIDAPATISAPERQPVPLHSEDDETPIISNDATTQDLNAVTHQSDSETMEPEEEGIPLPTPEKVSQPGPQNMMKWRSCWYWTIVLFVASIMIGGAIFIVLLATETISLPTPRTRTAEVRVQEGFASMESGQAETALAQFEEAAELDPENLSAWVGQALVHIDNGDLEQASEALAQAEALDASDTIFHFGQAYFYSAPGDTYDPEAAINEFTAVIQTCGQNDSLCAAARSARAGLYAWEINDYTKALVDMAIAIELETNPEDLVNLLLSRASIHLAADNVLSAIGDYESAYNVNPETGGDYLEQAAILAMAVQRLDITQQYYEQLLTDSPDNPHYLTGQGYVLLASGDIASAQTLADGIVGLHSDSLEARYLLGLALLANGEPALALAEFELVAAEPDTSLYNAVFFNPDFEHEIFYDMALAAYELEDLEQTLSLLTRSIDRYAEWPQPYLFRARLYLANEQPEQARADYEAARELAAGNEALIEIIDERLAELDES